MLLFQDEVILENDLATGHAKWPTLQPALAHGHLKRDVLHVLLEISITSRVNIVNYMKREKAMKDEETNMA